MMTVHKVGGGDAGGYADYLASAPVASRRGDYYLGREGEYASSPGRWHGRGAEALDLAGDVTRAELMAVWEGRDPRTGAIEVLRSGTGEHVAAVFAKPIVSTQICACFYFRTSPDRWIQGKL